MTRNIFPAAALALAIAVNAGAASAADPIKSGKWEFTSQLQMPPSAAPPGASLPPGVQPRPSGLSGPAQTLCVEPDKAIPTDPRQGCRVERMTRNGGTVNWTTACTTSQGNVRAEGVAHYRGDTMEATLTTQVPQQGGRVMETTQRITGRYLGPCTR